MNPTTIRIFGALALAVVMGILAITTRDQPYRRASLGLGGLAMLLLAVYNAAPLYGIDSRPLAVVALVVLLAGIGCYIMSWVKGEVLKRHEQMRTEMLAKIKQRREATAKRPPTPKP